MLNKYLLPEQEIVGRIHVINGIKVMLDYDLAVLYEIPTKRINEQVKRNKDRFPKDFSFQLSERQWEDLRSQFATTNFEMRRNPPYAFTEHGVLMLSSVLNNPKAVQVNIQLVRIFTKMRDILINQNNLLEQIDKLKDRMNYHDDKMDGVIKYLQRFVKEQTTERKPLGYKTKPTKSC